ncbi:MAG: cysteine hydrolase [Candidatus Obscuribacterales bacterium]|nr:cysteine hydrolase [Candidatus Obscuribacterales bacterium]
MKALILIDVQKGFDNPYWGQRNNPQAEKNMALLLESFRNLKWPIIHVKHMSTEAQSPLRPGQAGNEFKDLTAPVGTEIIIEKQVNSAFIGTNLEELLKAKGWQSLVIAGLTTDHCVSTTTRMAGNLGFKTCVVADATATFNKIGYDGKEYPAELVHELALASLHNEFATVLTTAEVLLDSSAS